MTVYYEAQERAFAPGIADGWPQTIPAPHTPHGRLVKVDDKRARSFDELAYPTPPEAAVPSPSVEEARQPQYARTWAALLETYRGDAEAASSVLFAAADWIAADRETVRAALASALTRAEQAEARVQGLEGALVTTLMPLEVLAGDCAALGPAPGVALTTYHAIAEGIFAGRAALDRAGSPQGGADG